LLIVLYSSAPAFSAAFTLVFFTTGSIGLGSSALTAFFCLLSRALPYSAPRLRRGGIKLISRYRPAVPYRLHQRRSIIYLSAISGYHR
jgi:hypothetical protein